MSNLKWRHQVSRFTPVVVRDWIIASRLAGLRQRNASRSVADVFSEVYATGVWGSGETFDSGSGSVGDTATSYAVYVRDLIQRTGARTAVDIGCGDFRVAAQFTDLLSGYYGVDVVKDLVTRNNKLYGGPNVTFLSLDASTDDLPRADICLVRQVLQHLSNEQIANILDRCRHYRFVLVTEHLPAPGAASLPNIDKPHGPDTRLDMGSWVDIASDPFNCRNVTEVLRLPAPRSQYQAGEMISSQLWCPNS